MASNIRKQDLRTTKTVRALFLAMDTLLGRCNFKRLTTIDICEEAMLSRATFYSHFTDKYDLLKHWVAHWRPEVNKIIEAKTYEDFEIAANRFYNKKKLIIKNIITDADDETSDILFDFVISALDSDGDEVAQNKADPKSIVLSMFFAGGTAKYLSWCINHKMPFELVNSHLYEMIQRYRDWWLE